LHIFKKGSRKGERCEKMCGVNETLCSLHNKSKSSEEIKSKPFEEIKSKPEETVSYKIIRINRLKLNHKYAFVKRINNKNIVVSCCNEHYLVKLPVNLQVLNIDSTQYLIRKSLSAKAEWVM
jgi:hypothetical protein